MSDGDIAKLDRIYMIFHDQSWKNLVNPVQEFAAPVWQWRKLCAGPIQVEFIPANRVLMVDGGYRDEWTVELFIQSTAACGPLPAPTRKRVQVHVSGRCR